MKRHISEEAHYERMRTLAEVNKKITKESQNRTNGTLIDYKRAANGVAYGIIKENHNYYVKIAGLKQDPNISDFAYVGGLANITNFQYKSLAEADKQRNMMFHSINEAIVNKPSKTGSKKRLNEDVAGKEIENAENKLGDLDAATSAAEMPVNQPSPEGGEEMPTDELPSDGGEEMPSPEGGEEMPTDELPSDDGEEEMPTDELPSDDGEEEMPNPEGEENKDITTEEIEKSLGKLTNKLRKTELTDSQVKSYVNTFLSAFKDKFPDVEVEDRKAMADKITKVVPDEDIEGLGQNVEDTAGNEEMAEGQCSECGGFAKYAESRGYSKESLMECGEEEMGNLVSGYANAYGEGENDGDHKTVALFIKLMPQVLDILKNEYGHDDYANELEPEVNSMDESTEEDIHAKIDEAWGGGLAGLGKAALGSIKKAGTGIGNAVGNAAKNVSTGVGNAVERGKQAYQAGSQTQDIKSGIKKRNASLDKIQAMAGNLVNQIAAANAGAAKAGQEPINVGSLLQTMSNQLRKTGGGVDLSKYKAEGVDPANIETQPNMEQLEEIKIPEKTGKKLSTNVPVKAIKEEEEPEGEDLDIDNTEETDTEDNNEFDFAPEAQSLGGGVVKPDGAPTTGIDINVDGQSKTVNISVNEVVQKLRETLNALVNETKGGNKVPIMKGAKVVNEEKPSAGLSKEKKSEVVKKAKAGEDIGKKGKGFEKVAKKAEKEYGSKEAGEKVAAAAMWKNMKKEGVENNKKQMTESELKVRKYIHNRLEEHAGLRKPILTESKKSDALKKLDAMIDNQYKLFEGVTLKKKVN